MSEVDRAYEKLEGSDPLGAVHCLEAAGARGDSACFLELGKWYLEGRHVPRDLSRARDHFRRAGTMGDLTAERVYICFLANGVGGSLQWSTAKERLRSLARTDRTAALQLDLLGSMGIDDNGIPLARPFGRRVNSQLEAWIFESFASPAECDYLIQTAKPLLQTSMIVDPNTGQLRPHPVRTSDAAMFPWVSADMVITALNRRIAAASSTDVSQGEPLQILRYSPGQEYRSHFDALPAGNNQRIMTMLVYLNEDYAGGETLFTKCALKVAGRTGTALLFKNAHPGGMPDVRSEHAGLPVLSGRKFVASRWIREHALAAD